MSPFYTNWSLYITYTFSSGHLNQSNPASGGLDVAPTWEERINSLVGGREQGLALTTPGPSMSRAAKEFNIAWI